jgi:Zn-dependent protease
LFGFPVHLDISFVIIMGVLGYYPGVTLVDMGLWLLITPVAVLVHELGHAFLARAAGASPQIALAGFGGVTTYIPPDPLSRARSLGISLAGPGVGLVLGLALITTRAALGDQLDPYGWQASALRIGIWTCIAWSVLNLLPVLPLDGGQAMRELLPGSPEVRARRAEVVSLVSAILAAAAAFLIFQQPFLALFMAFFGVNNLLTLRQSRSDTGADSAATTPEQAVVELLWRAQPAQARELLGSLPPSTPVDLAVHGAVLALTGDHDQGHALLTQEVQRRPGDPNAAALLFLTLTLEHDWDALIATLQGPVGPSVRPTVVERAIQEAENVGRDDVAGRLRLLADRPAN